MAFTVEDGSGLSTSNAYITVQEFKDHHTDRGVGAATDGTFTNNQIQGFIVQATDYIDKRFGKRFRGYRQRREQALEWPRLDAYDNDDYRFNDIPEQLKKATAEYALLAGQLGRNLAPVPDTGFSIIDPNTGEEVPDKGSITSEREAVGPIETETRYSDGSTGDRPMTTSGNMVQRIPEYPQADLWLEEMLRTDRNVGRG